MAERLLLARCVVPSSVTWLSVTSPMAMPIRPIFLNSSSSCGSKAVRNLQKVEWSGVCPSSSHMKSSRLNAASSNPRLERTRLLIP